VPASSRVRTEAAALPALVLLCSIPADLFFPLQKENGSGGPFSLNSDSNYFIAVEGETRVNLEWIYNEILT
jgi:hypothetical protein